MRQEPPIKSDKLESLIHLALSVQNYCATIQGVGLVDYLHDPMLLADLVGKLPSDLKLDWGRYQMALARVDVGVFGKWLLALATCASQVTSIGPSMAVSNYEAKNTGKQPKQRIMVHEVIEQKRNSTSQQDSCPQCNEDHHLSDCSRFCALTTHERWKVCCTSVHAVQRKTWTKC